MRSITCSIVAILAFSVNLTSIAIAEDVGDFLSRYREIVDRQVSSRTSFQINGHYENDRINPNGKRKDRHILAELNYARNQTHEKLQQLIIQEFDLEPPKHFERVFVRGAHRNFLVQRTSPKSSFMVLQLDVPATNYDSIISQRRDLLVNSYFLLGGHSVANLLASKDFHVNKIEKKTVDNSELISIDFVYDAPDRSYQMAGQFAVDPDLEMAIREQFVTIKLPASPVSNQEIQMTCTYAKMGKIVFPKEVDFILKVEGSSITDHEHFKAVGFSDAPVPDSEFRLAAFGLGDLDRATPRSRFDFGFWAIGFAILAFVLSVILKWRGRRVATHSTS